MADPVPATKIRVTLSIEMPLDKMTAEEQKELRPQFEDMKAEMAKTAPEGTSVGLGIEYL